MENNILFPQHQKLLDGSGVSKEVAEARGYRSVTEKSELKKLGFPDYQCNGPSLLIPIWNFQGEIVSYQLRPDNPRIESGKPVKYETLAGTSMVLDIPSEIVEKLKDPSIPLLITEGPRKADSAVSRGLCCIALLGVWNWRGSNEYGGKTALPDWENIALNDRPVYIVFDSDVMTKSAVHQALVRLKLFLESRKARVKVIYLPSEEGGQKVGLDDYFVSGHSVQDLMTLASNQIRELPIEERGDKLYQETESGLIWNKSTKDGCLSVHLTNFTAKITADITEDDGVEKRKRFEIEANLLGKEHRFPIHASQFSGMNWVTENMGPGAILNAGFGIKDRARTAIQFLSNGYLTKSIFTHTGWRKINNQWVYLHKGGAIGNDGENSEIEVNLPDSLKYFHLPALSEREQLTPPINSALQFLEVAPKNITVPLMASVFRAVIGNVDFSIHVSGPTGVFKTELSALIQQFFGSEMDSRNLPGSWSGTGNALEMLAFNCKDSILVVDDFAPHGTSNDVHRYHREADRIFRAQGNHSGRQRLNSNATLKVSKPPRGLILSTGEDVPRGQSLQARILILEISPGSVDKSKLTKCQRDAANGLYAQVMAGFIQWLAPKYQQILDGLKEEEREFLNELNRDEQHPRIPFIIANLGLGLKLFLSYAKDISAITNEQSEPLWIEWWAVLKELGRSQIQYQLTSDPALKFIDLLNSAIASGRAHLSGSKGGEPEENPEAWGWNRPNIEWVPKGPWIGWFNGDDLYLEANSAFAAAQEMGVAIGEPLTVSPRTLNKRLWEGKLLRSKDERRNTYFIRRNFEERQHKVLHLSINRLTPSKETDKPDISANKSGELDQEEGPSDQMSGWVSAFNSQQPIDPTSEILKKTDSSIGDVGFVSSNDGKDRVIDLDQSNGDPKCRIVSGKTDNGLLEPIQNPTYPNGQPCYSCGGSRFWKSENDKITCATCHPPAPDNLVAEWITPE